MNSDKLVSGCLKRNSKNPFKRHELRQISIEKPSVSHKYLNFSHVSPKKVSHAKTICSCRNSTSKNWSK